jgi:hypothetical protein
MIRLQERGVASFWGSCIETGFIWSYPLCWFLYTTSRFCNWIYFRHHAWLIVRVVIVNLNHWTANARMKAFSPSPSKVPHSQVRLMTGYRSRDPDPVSEMLCLKKTKSQVIAYELVGVSKSFRIESITKYALTTVNTCWEATKRVMAAKLTILTHKIAI